MGLHIIIALLHDRPGVLHRTVSLLRRRDYNILSLSVGRSETAGISRMTITVDVENATQIVRQLDRLVEVIGVADATTLPSIQRETALIKIRTDPEAVMTLLDLTRSSGGRVLDDGPEDVIIEITDAPEQVEQFVNAIRRFGIAELLCTGRFAMMRGRSPQALEVPTDYRAQADGAPNQEAA